MELKDYQTRTLNVFTRWRNELNTARLNSETSVAALEQAGVDVPADIRNYPKTAWQRLASAAEVASGSKPYVERTATAGYSIPHVCFKVPTGGGKTLLGLPHWSA